MAPPQQADAVLINARLEYIEQLTDAIGSYVVGKIAELWVESRRRVRAFQELLQGIPRWNSTVFEAHAIAICSRAPYLDKLIAAVLIATVKLLASIKIGDGDEQVRLKLPTNEAFLSKVFVKTARIFYEAPELIREPYAQKVLAVQLAIEKAIRDMLPLADLLDSYTSSAGGGAAAEAPEAEPEEEKDGESEPDEEAKAEEENEGEGESAGDDEAEVEKRVSFGQQPDAAAAPPPFALQQFQPQPAALPGGGEIPAPPLQAPAPAMAAVPYAAAPPLAPPQLQQQQQQPQQQLRPDAEEKIDW